MRTNTIKKLDESNANFIEFILQLNKLSKIDYAYNKFLYYIIIITILIIKMKVLIVRSVRVTIK